MAYDYLNPEKEKSKLKLRLLLTRYKLLGIQFRRDDYDFCDVVVVHLSRKGKLIEIILRWEEYTTARVLSEADKK